MESAHSDILLCQRANLVEKVNMRGGLLTQLLSRKVINQRAMRVIKTGRTLDEMCEELLDILSQSGSKAFDLFCEALKADGQDEIVKLYLKPPVDSQVGDKQQETGDVSNTKCNRVAGVQESSPPSSVCSQAGSQHSGARDGSPRESSQIIVQETAVASPRGDNTVVHSDGSSDCHGNRDVTRTQAVMIHEEFQQHLYRRSIEQARSEQHLGQGQLNHGQTKGQGYNPDYEREARYLYQNLLHDPKSASGSVYSVLSPTKSLSPQEKDRLLLNMGVPIKSVPDAMTGYSNLSKFDPPLGRDYMNNKYESVVVKDSVPSSMKPNSVSTAIYLFIYLFANPSIYLFIYLFAHPPHVFNQSSLPIPSRNPDIDSSPSKCVNLPSREHFINNIPSPQKVFSEHQQNISRPQKHFDDHRNTIPSPQKAFDDQRLEGRLSQAPQTIQETDSVFHFNRNLTPTQTVEMAQAAIESDHRLHEFHLGKPSSPSIHSFVNQLAKSPSHFPSKSYNDSQNIEPNNLNIEREQHRNRNITPSPPPTLERDFIEMPRYIEVANNGSEYRSMISLPRHVERALPASRQPDLLHEEVLAKGDNQTPPRLPRNDSVDTMHKRPSSEQLETDSKRFREDVDSVPSYLTSDPATTLKVTSQGHDPSKIKMVPIPQNKGTKVETVPFTIVEEPKRKPSLPSVVIKADIQEEKGQRSSLLGVMDDPDIDLTDGPIDVKVELTTRQFYLQNFKKAYAMRRIPRGKALILNVNSVVGKTDRRGTDIDRENLHNLLCQLHFDVIVYNDEDGLTAIEMVKKLQDFSQHSGHAHADCTVVCILSHGEEGYIFGADGRKFELDAIFQLFDNTCCPDLRGKPKLFIIQACRGGALDRGIQYYPDEHDGSDARVRQVPSMSDMLIFYPTQNGYYAWRNRDRGSWYVEALVQVFMKYAQCEDVCAMLNRVNLLVSKKVSHCPNLEMDQMSQMSEYKSTLRMPHLFFFPGIGGCS